MNLCCPVREQMKYSPENTSLLEICILLCYELEGLALTRISARVCENQTENDNERLCRRYGWEFRYIPAILGFG